MNTPPEPLHRRIASAMARLQVITGGAERRAADQAGVSPLQMSILRQLQARPGLRAGALAKALGVTPGTISVAVSALRRKHLVHQQRDPEEHRAVVLELTENGRATATRLEGWADERLEPLVAGLEQDEAGDVLAALLAMLRAAEQRGLIDGTRMCLFCRWFEPGGGPKPDRPHRCELLGVGLAKTDLRVDCPEFESGPPKSTFAGRGTAPGS